MIQNGRYSGLRSGTATIYPARRYLSTDLASVDAIESAVFGTESRYPRFFFVQAMEVFGSGFWVAGDDQEVVGYVITVIDSTISTRGWILSLAVIPERRRLGAANNLMGAAERYLVEHGCTEAALTVDPTNRPARNLYEKRGYHVISRFEDYFGPAEDRLLAVAPLPGHLPPTVATPAADPRSQWGG